MLDAEEGRLVLIAASRTHGMTLIELMVGLAIVGLLLMFGLPSFATFLANSKVRNAAEGVQTGLSLARTDAMSRNANVEFVLTNDSVDLGTVNTITPEISGKNWVVRTMNPVTAQYDLIQTKSGSEGTGQVEGSAIVIQTAGSVSQVTFRGLGGTQGLPATATFDFSNPSGGACNTSSTPGPIRCLRVQVSVSGQVKTCDPSTASPDTRAC